MGKELLAFLDKWLARIISNLAGLSVALLTILVFFQVIARYVLEMSTGGITELPTFLMIIAVWMAGAVNARKEDGHIKLDLIEMMIRNKKIVYSIKLFVNMITIVSLAVFSYLSFIFVTHLKETGDTSVGLAMPMWWLAAVLLVSGILMTVYNVVNLCRVGKEMQK